MISIFHKVKIVLPTLSIKWCYILSVWVKNSTLQYLKQKIYKIFQLKHFKKFFFLFKNFIGNKNLINVQNESFFKVRCIGFYCVFHSCFHTITSNKTKFDYEFLVWILFRQNELPYFSQFHSWSEDWWGGMRQAQCNINFGGFWCVCFSCLWAERR